MKTGDRGFLMTEAVLAVAVLAVGIVALLRASSAALRLGSESHDLYRAALLVEGRSWALERAPSSEAAEQEEDPELGPVEWSREDVPVGVEGAAGERVRASWSRRGRGRELSLTVLRRSP